MQDVEIWIRNTGPGSEVRVDYVRGECPIFINPRAGFQIPPESIPAEGTLKESIGGFKS